MKILVKNPSGKTTETIINGNSAIIGRSNKSDVSILDEALSRQHCKIEIENDAFYVTDLASANGVFIDGKRIPANTRTMFNSFNQLCLSHLECVVEDFELVDPATIKPVPRARKTDGVVPDSPTRKINREELDQYRKINKKRNATELAAGFILPALIMVAAAFYYFSNDEVAVVAKNSPEVVPQISSAKVAPDMFLAPPQYEAMANKSDCAKNQAKCESLGINEKKHETLVQLDNEYFVYLNPSLHLSDLKYKNILQHKLAPDLMAFKTLIYSRFFDEYIFGKISQIHLIINSPEGKPLGVYRLHAKRYSPRDIVRRNLMQNMSKALAEGNPKIFFDDLNAKIPMMEISPSSP